jgi:phytoene/squalene synthetase
VDYHEGGDSMNTNPEPVDDPTPTQKIWQPVSDLDRAQQKAFQSLMYAMTHNDMETADQARRQIAEIEEQQRVAHAAARQYLLKKVHA